MRRTMLLTIAPLLSLAAADAAHAGGPGPVAGGPDVRHDQAVCGGLPPLYAQDTTLRASAGVAIASQSYGGTAFDTEAADDFKVPAGGWHIGEVDVSGVYFNGTATALNETVTFYKNAGGLPGAQLASYTVIGADISGTFCIRLHPKMHLTRGRYWVSVVANMPAAPMAMWGWASLVPPVVMKPAAWRNPGLGLGLPPMCANWQVETSCVNAGQGDHFFTLR